MAFRIILVRARNSLNMGAVARAMANFGLEDLALVAPYDQAWHTARSARAGAAVLARARVFSTLPQALAGCAYVIGTTDGAHRTPALPLEDWPAVAASLPPDSGAAAPVALIFGSEKTGLGVDEISFCDRLARIPTSPGAPSMNLGQAVAVCAYELIRASPPRTSTHPGAPPPACAKPPVPPSAAPAISPAARERLLEIWYPMLEQINAVRPAHHASQTRALRQMLTRWRLTPEDARRLLGLARQLRHALDRTADSA